MNADPRDWRNALACVVQEAHGKWWKELNSKNPPIFGHPKSINIPFVGKMVNGFCGFLTDFLDICFFVGGFHWHVDDVCCPLFGTPLYFRKMNGAWDMNADPCHLRLWHHWEWDEAIHGRDAQGAANWRDDSIVGEGRRSKHIETILEWV